MAAIDMRDLAKHYGETRAVDGVSLRVETGEVLALLGPNGAGKTTTVEVLEGHRRRTAGEVTVLGFDPETGGREFRERIGIVLQSGAVERELTVREAVELYAGMYPRRRSTDEVIELVGLEENADARTKTLSGGQQRRLELALGIIGDPDVIFLDEPTTGFDPSARRQAWELVGNLRGLGKTILLTTHYMDEAQNLADRVAVIARGRIVAEGPPESIGGRDTRQAVISFRLPPAASGLSDVLPAARSTAEGGVEVTTDQPTEMLHRLTGWALEQGVELAGLTVTRPSLEDVYLALTEGGDQ